MPPSRDEIRQIAANQRSLLSGLSPSPQARGVLSKSAQLAQFRQMTGDTSWVDDAMTRATHPQHQRLLRILKDHGWDGLGEYLSTLGKASKRGK